MTVVAFVNEIVYNFAGLVLSVRDIQSSRLSKRSYFVMTLSLNLCSAPACTHGQGLRPLPKVERDEDAGSRAYTVEELHHPEPPSIIGKYLTQRLAAARQNAAFSSNLLRCNHGLLFSG